MKVVGHVFRVTILICEIWQVGKLPYFILVNESGGEEVKTVNINSIKPPGAREDHCVGIAYKR